ncbi:MAG: glycosyl hydrolase-related protein [bacterium]
MLKSNYEKLFGFAKVAVLSLSVICTAQTMVLAASGTITGVNQRPWILNDNGQLKSETELIVHNTGGTEFEAWVKITVPGKAAYMESLGKLVVGKATKIVHVLELAKDGDRVTFALYDNKDGAGTALDTQTYAQMKIRHWRFYVGHNSHLDIGYTDYQEYLKDTKWPGFWDKALLKDMPNSDTWSDDSKVRLEVEGVYQLDTSLRVRSADWFEILRERLQQGRFAYGAAFANNAHSNWGAEELARSAYFSERFFKDKTGVESTKNIIMRDEPTLSWGAIDAMVESGAKSFAIHHNSDHNPWRGTAVYPEIFYAQGRNPANKLLVWNSPVENYCIDELKFCEANTPDVISHITTKLMGYQNSTKYPYDVAMVNFTFRGDNCPMSHQVYQNLKAINDKGYVYPRIINANYNTFFDDVATNWSASIPTYKGTIEDWWNFGAASTAYETGLNRVNHDKLSSAELFATLASVVVPNRRYPYETLANAYENMILWDEHTWGSPRPAVDEQWRWKRNTAIASDVASSKVLTDSLAALNKNIPTTGKTIVIHNTLSWERSDVVTLKQSDLPAHLNITDVESGKTVNDQKIDNGTLVFVAANVPGLGYKTFRVASRADDPVFTTSVKTTANTLENNFFKITFNSAGNITSILDKQNANAEMVDASAPYPLNQYVIFKEGTLVGQVATATVSTCVGAIQGTMMADGATTGLDSLNRKVILYDSLPRIDFCNDAVKGRQLANVEMGYFCFPLKVNNFRIRHEMPTGDMRPGIHADINNPESEQYYTSSTAFYTINKWVDVSNQKDWGITFASLQAPLLSYGKPELGWSKKTWDVNYNADNPWIYSMAFNNEWQTNFQKTQPGRAIFQYALRSHAGGSWQAGNAETFGAEVASPLKSSIIADAQAGHGFNKAKGQFIGIDKNNVVLTAAKTAEANGDGLILRFNEIKGLSTSVKIDLSWFAPTSVIETDLIENDKTPLALTRNAVTLTIQPFGFKTLRLLRGAMPEPVSGMAATFNTNGCQVTWNDMPSASHFEVFRSTSKDFKAGTGTYVASVSVNHYYDPALRSGLSRTYYYTVRTVNAGRKSSFPTPVQAVNGILPDTLAPSVPVLSGQLLHSSKVTLSWQPSTDNYAIKGYKVFRDGKQIADLPEEFNSWLDTTVRPNNTYRYTVQACDVNHNLSAASTPFVLATPCPITITPENIAPDAAISTSSEFSSEYCAANAVDANVGTGSGEWASKREKTPWIQLTWSSSKTIDKVILYDRFNKDDNATGGTLSFSDGSQISVTGIPANGEGKEVPFTAKTVTWVKFHITGGVGPNVGLSEIEVNVKR